MPTHDNPWSEIVPLTPYIDGDPVMSAVKIPPLDGDNAETHRWVCLVHDMRKRHGGGIDLLWVVFTRTYRIYASERNIGPTPMLAYTRLVEIGDEAWVTYDLAA